MNILLNNNNYYFLIILETNNSFNTCYESCIEDKYFSKHNCFPNPFIDKYFILRKIGNNFNNVCNKSVEYFKVYESLCERSCAKNCHEHYYSLRLDNTHYL